MSSLLKGDAADTLTIEDGIATLTISNPSARNALDDVTRRAVLEALRRAAADTTCVAVVMVGAGETFCAGGDLASMPTDEPAIRRRLGEMHDIVRLIHAGPKPVVVAVDGFASGSGLSFVAAADYVVASDRARFACPFGDIGLIADTGLLWTMPRRIGWAESRRWMLEGGQVDVVRAVALGLVDEVVPSDQIMVRARRYASRFSKKPPLAVAATRRLLAGSSASLDEVLERELAAQIDLLASEDFGEARRAFFEKRAPEIKRPVDGPGDTAR